MNITSRKQSSPISCIEADGVEHCGNPSIAKILNYRFSTIGTNLAMKLKSFVTLPSPPASSTDLPKFVFKPITEEFVHSQLNPIQTGLFWSICDWGGLLGPPLCISGTNNARVMKFTHNDHLRTKKPHTQF